MFELSKYVALPVSICVLIVITTASAITYASIEQKNIAVIILEPANNSYGYVAQSVEPKSKPTMIILDLLSQNYYKGRKIVMLFNLYY